MLQAVKVKLVSSAYKILVVAKSIMLERSLMYTKNSNGPSIEPRTQLFEGWIMLFTA